MLTPLHDEFEAKSKKFSAGAVDATPTLDADRVVNVGDAVVSA